MAEKKCGWPPSEPSSVTHTQHTGKSPLVRLPLCLMKNVSTYNMRILTSRRSWFLQIVVIFISYLRLRKSLIKIVIELLLAAFEMMTTRRHCIEMFGPRYDSVQ